MVVLIVCGPWLQIMSNAQRLRRMLHPGHHLRVHNIVRWLVGTTAVQFQDVEVGTASPTRCTAASGEAGG